MATGSDADGIIHYHPKAGGATGRNARLGVFLNIYGVHDWKLEGAKSRGCWNGKTKRFAAKAMPWIMHFPSCCRKTTMRS